MSDESKKTSDFATPTSFFLKDRGERALYTSAYPTADIPVPLTRDGFEALVERCVAYYEPALPLNDSMRSVLAAYIHHMTNEQTKSTIEKLAGAMFKSVSNALTWTIDQEVKMRRQEEVAMIQAQQKAESDKQAKDNAIAKAQAKRAKKPGKYRANEKAQ